MSLKIIQITDAHGRSGGAMQSVMLSRGLAEAGCQVLFCATERSAAFRWAREAGLEVQPVRFGNLWDQWLASRKLRILSREFGADIVHTHHTKAHNAGLLATFGGGMPPLVVNRGVLFKPQFPLKFRSRRSAGIITNSKTVKEVLLRAGVAEDKVFVVYNGKAVPDLAALRDSAPALREELGLPDGCPVVGAVGRSTPEKGFQHLVEAAPEILNHNPDAVFLLVGAGTERFLPRLRELGVADRFRLPGHRKNAARLMGLMNVFVLPSVDMESCPNVLLEAMGAAVPAVGSAIGGVGEILVDGKTGFLVPPADPTALATATRRLLDMPDTAARMGREGRARVLAEFTPERKVVETLAVYREVARRRYG